MKGRKGLKGRKGRKGSWGNNRISAHLLFINFRGGVVRSFEGLHTMLRGMPRRSDALFHSTVFVKFELSTLN